MFRQGVDPILSSGHRAVNRSRSCGESSRSPAMKASPPPRQTSIPPPEKHRMSSDDNVIPPWGQLPAADFPVSPMSAHSYTESWSGSSNTQSSPRTPDFGLPTITSIARPNETPITAFLSQFYDSEASPNGVYPRLSATEAEHSSIFHSVKDQKITIMPLPIFSPEAVPMELEIARLPDTPSSVRAEDHLAEPSSTDSRTLFAPHPPLPDARRTRRYARDFVCARVSHESVEEPKPASSQSMETSQTSPASEDHEISLSLAHTSVPSSTMPLAFEFPAPPPMSPNLGFLSESETKEVQEFLREWCERQNGRGLSRGQPSATSPPILIDAPQVSAEYNNRASDEFSWEAKDSDPEDVLAAGDTTRCSALIHEASLMLGLPSDEYQRPSHDVHPSAPQVSGSADARRQDQSAPDLSNVADEPGARWTSGIPSATQGLPQKPRFVTLKDRNQSTIGVQSSASPQRDKNIDHPQESRNWGEIPTKYYPLPQVLPLSPQKSLPAGRQAVPPILRHKSAEAIRPQLAARKRYGHVFQLGDSISLRPSRSTVDVNDDAFVHPREPPKPVPPTPTPPAKRIPALDRLESSLQRLKVHGPGHHQKSHSEVKNAGTPPKDLTKAKDKRPSLPSVLRPQKQRSSQDLSQRCEHLAAARVGRHLSSPVPPVAGPAWGVPQGGAEPTGETGPSNIKKHYYYISSEKLAPVGSFMDMDAPSKKSPHRASMRSPVSKENMKKLAKAAARMSHGVFAWGKNLAGSKKPPAATTEEKEVPDT